MLVATIAATGALLMTAASVPSTQPASLKTALEAIGSSTVLFGHQSVGGNLLDALRALAEAEGAPLRILEVKGARELQPGTFGHLLVAANGEPRRKLESFASALSGGDPDVALVKFCYVDFDDTTDAAALFAAYEAALRELQAQHPRTTFVHVTVPLVADEGLLKWLAKKLLGKKTGAVASNARRDEFNALLRRAHVADPLFDLARLEATDSSGQPVAATLDGKPVPMLAGEYTDDGGHLNGAGALRGAIELVRVLAEALAGRAGAGTGGSGAAAR